MLLEKIEGHDLWHEGDMWNTQKLFPQPLIIEAMLDDKIIKHISQSSLITAQNVFLFREDSFKNDFTQRRGRFYGTIKGASIPENRKASTVKDWDITKSTNGEVRVYRYTSIFINEDKHGDLVGGLVFFSKIKSEPPWKIVSIEKTNDNELLFTLGQ